VTMIIPAMMIDSYLVLCIVVAMIVSAVSYYIFKRFEQSFIWHDIRGNAIYDGMRQHENYCVTQVQPKM